MWLLVLLAFIVTGVVVLWGIRLFSKLRRIPLFVLVPLFLAVYIPSSIVVLVPIDLMSSSDPNHPMFYLSEHTRLVIWRVIYWLAFALTWAVLPVLQSYIESGYHEPTKKLFQALRQNARYQLLMLAAGIVGLFYMLITTKGLTLGSVKSLVIALAHCYALVLAIWMLGHGLVNLPRAMWNDADPKVFLNHWYKQATRISDAFAEAQSGYADVVAEIKALAQYKDGPFVEWIDELLDDVEMGPETRYRGSARVTVDPTMIGKEYLSSLSSRLYRTKSRLIRHEAEWQKLLKDCSVAEDILNAQTERTLVFRFSKTRFSPRMAYLYYTKVHTGFSRAVAVVLAGISVILAWSEVTHGTKASIVNYMIRASYGLWQQLLSTLILGYMCWAAFSSLTRIRVFNVYALVHRSSDMSSLLFYAMYACRLTVPLSYNYLNLISSRESVFEEFLGKSINLTPLGSYFNDWLPRLIVLPMALTLFHFYDKMRDFLGFGLSFDDNDESGESFGSMIEGRELVSRALSDPRSRFAYHGLERHSAFANATHPSRPSIDRYEDRPFTAAVTQEPANETINERLGDAVDTVKSFFGSVFTRVSNLRNSNATDGGYINV
ncbi:hypothetical protein TRVA0_004S03928 [Trichomonascus vanleenenianus]|uniref:LMBR1 domain-containing protein n=1 Tax=Trichomonascus vanleenenianus TaxID=2268995 RepID=UPI003EC9F039